MHKDNGDREDKQQREVEGTKAVRVRVQTDSQTDSQTVWALHNVIIVN